MLRSSGYPDQVDDHLIAGFEIAAGDLRTAAVRGADSNHNRGQLPVVQRPDPVAVV